MFNLAGYVDAKKPSTIDCRTLPEEPDLGLHDDVQYYVNPLFFARA